METAGLSEVIQGLMTFSALVTYESRFESLVHEGCDHLALLSSPNFGSSKNFDTKISKVVGMTADFGAEVARKHSMAELERVSALCYAFGSLLAWSFSDYSGTGEEGV
jgi:hypothetical protein